MASAWRRRCIREVPPNARPSCAGERSLVIEHVAVEDVFWWHSVDLGERVTPGHKAPELLEREWANLRLPDLAGHSVLDIGCWDGWFSFRAEREGAARVVALDH